MKSYQIPYSPFYILILIQVAYFDIQIYSSRTLFTHLNMKIYFLSFIQTFQQNVIFQVAYSHFLIEG